jgi:TonB family protein
MLPAALILAQITAPAPMLPPIDKWTVDFGDSSCLATRKFGDKAHPVTFAFESAVGEVGGTFFLITDGTSREPRDGKARITLDSGPTLSIPWVSTSASATTRVFRMRAEQSFWAALTNATSMHVEGIERPPFTLRIGSIAKVSKSVEACGADLLRSWGADPDALASAPTGKVVEWIRADDYPAAAIKAKQHGTVKTVSTVGPDGAPTSCRVVVSSRYPLLDDASCSAIMARARFATATTPVRYFVRQITWNLPTFIGGPPPTVYIPR